MKENLFTLLSISLKATQKQTSYVFDVYRALVRQTMMLSVDHINPVSVAAINRGGEILKYLILSRRNIM